MSDAPAAHFVFVSYAHADHEFVERLIADLQARGVGIWIDNQGLTPGTPDWEEGLRQAIRASRGVLLVASRSSRQSRYVKDELGIARMYERPIYPVWAVGEQWLDSIPMGLGMAQYVDMRGERYAEGLTTIVSTLNKGETVTVVALETATAESLPTTPPRNPYKGLRAFTGEDAGDFFGRAALVDDLLRAVDEALATEKEGAARLLAVVGPSGSGKSSAVMAGLLPRLRAGALPGSATWVYLAPMVPGMHPLEALTVTLGRGSERSLSAIREDLNDDSTRGLHLLASRLVTHVETRVVLLVDQFEELFTQTADERERQHLIDLLVAAATEPRGPLLVLLTMRADFYDRLMAYPELWALVESRTRFVTPPTVDELRAAIEGPAALPDVRVSFEGSLVGDLLFEVRGQVGALPLLEFTLDQLFERRAGRRLTEAAYREIGGVRGALAKHAEETYAALPSDAHREMARALFLRLIDPGATAQDTTRRRASLGELTLPDAVQTTLMRETAEAFVQARLLVTNETAGLTTLEVAHEALIREWPRLADWVREAREDVRRQESISADAAEWERHGRPADYLYRGAALDEAQSWAERGTPSTTEVAFIAAGQAARTREEETTRAREARALELAWQAARANHRAASRLRLLAGALVVFLVAAAVLTTLALGSAASEAQARRVAVAQRNLALSGELAAESINAEPSQIDLALLLSLAAIHVDNTLPARDSLLRGLEYSPALLHILNGHTDYVASVAFNPAGTMLASGSYDHTIRLWDVASGHLLRILHSPSIVGSVAFSPDGKTLASSYGRAIQLWDVAGGRLRRILHSPSGVSSLAFSPAGQTLASGHFDDTIRLWDAASGRLRRILRGHTAPVNSVAFSPDGKMLISAAGVLGGSNDNTVRLWDVASGRLRRILRGHTRAVESVACSPDGKIVASGSADDTIRLWDATSGRLLRVLRGPAKVVESVAFSPDGQTLASGSGDNTVRLWDVASGRLVRTLSGHTGTVFSVAFSPAGDTVASGSRDHTIRLWGIGARQALGLLLSGHAQFVPSVAFSPGGKALASGSADATIRLWAVGSGHLLRVLRGDTAPVNGVAWSPNGQTLASAAGYPDRPGDDTVRLWDAGSGHLLRTLRGHTQFVQSVAFSPDGQTLASGSADHTIRLWDVASGRLLRILRGHTDVVESVAFSPDGQTLASGSDDETVRLWDVASGRLLRTLHGHSDWVQSVAFSPDGKMVASASADATVRLWSVASGRLLRIFTGRTPAEFGVAFSPNGKMLASAGADGLIRLWDVASGQLLYILTGHTDAVFSVAFSPDGQTLASGSNDRTVRLWPLALHAWERAACGIANRNLTPSEWTQYVGNQPYHKTCTGVS